MNSVARLASRIRGEAVDRAPNFDIVMAFAAHQIGEPLASFYLDYRVLTRANLATAEKFGLDIVQAISDPYREAADCGTEIEFPPDGLPLRRHPLLVEPADLARLRIPAPADGRRMSDRLEGVRLLHERATGELPVMGWVEGALALANVLRGDTALMMDLYDRPAWVQELLEVCTVAQIAFARAQVEAGADIIGLGDAIASQVSPGMYARFALPGEQRIFRAVREMGAICRLHICGDTTHIVALMGQTGADIVDLDWMVDLRSAAECYGATGPALCGNFDPVEIMLRGSEDQVCQAVAECLRGGGTRCISAAGCEIPDLTPERNLHAQRRALQRGIPESSQ